MKKSALTATIILALLFLSIITPTAHAIKIMTEDNIVIAEDEIIDDDIIIIAENIHIKGTVEGDVVAIGLSIINDGTVEGDLIAIGSSINIKGNTGDDLITAGETINIDGPTIDNMIALGSKITIFKDTKITRDSIIVAAEKANIDGTMQRDAKIYGKNIVISGNINGNATVKSDRLTILSSSIIDGSLNYTGPEEAVIENTDSVKGKTIYQKTVKQHKLTPLETLKNKINGIVALLFVGIILICFMPKLTENGEKAIRNKTMASALVGLVGLIVIPIISFMLIFTIIGLPIALIAMALYLISIYISKIFVSIALGGLIRAQIKRTKNQAMVASLVIGVIALEIIFMLPYIGGIAVLTTIMLGFGAIMLACINQYKGTKKRKRTI